MWSAAKATYVNDWERHMREMRMVNEEAFKYLLKIPPRYWSKSRFPFQSKCDALLNNMSETFNSVILGPREKPIITMLDEIRTYLMERWADQRKKSAAQVEDINPKIKKRLQNEKKYTNKWMPRSLMFLFGIKLSFMLLRDIKVVPYVSAWY